MASQLPRSQDLPRKLRDLFSSNRLTVLLAAVVTSVGLAKYPIQRYSKEHHTLCTALSYDTVCRTKIAVSMCQVERLTRQEECTTRRERPSVGSPSATESWLTFPANAIADAPQPQLPSPPRYNATSCRRSQHPNLAKNAT